MALRRRRARDFSPTSEDMVVLLEDPAERYRRYGMMNHFEETPDHYLIRVEFPRRVPKSALRYSPDLPREMPDYETQVRLTDGTLLVEARLTDPRFQDVVDRGTSFPSGFELHFHVPNASTPVEEKYQDKTLEVIVPKRRHTRR